MAYMNKRGSLNIGTRVEIGSAVIAAAVGQSVGAKVKARDFMPHIDKPGQINLAETRIEDVMTVMSRAADFTKEAAKSGAKPRKVSNEYLSGKEYRARKR